MDRLYIRRCMNGKSFAASADPEFKGLEGKRCPITGGSYEADTKEVSPQNAEVMGINYDQVMAGVQKDGLYFGKFKISLGDTMVME
jgi:hypothetical protein